MADPNLSSFIWSVADLLRGDYKQSEYGKVILPFTVLRRLDCVLEATKPAVLAEKDKREKAGLNPEPFLLKTSKQLFYNTSPLDLKKLMGDQDHIGENLRAYMQAFWPSPGCSTSSPKSSPPSTCTPPPSATPGWARCSRN
jgi:type I restriction enzyme M protein